MGWADLVLFLVAIFCALPAAAVPVYFGIFVSGLLPVPITVDSHPEWHSPPTLANSPLIHNLLLLLVFPLQHTATVRGPVKSAIKLVIPEACFRSFYAMTSALALGVLMYFWQPMPTVVWEVSSPPLTYAIMGLCWVSYLGVSASILTLDPFALAIVGLREPIGKLLGWKDEEPKLIDTGLYGLMRHPAYTMLMMGMWITPKMTVGHLLIAAVLSLYMVLAVKYFEEPALVKLLGPTYSKYMEKTPRFIPCFALSRRSKTD